MLIAYDHADARLLPLPSDADLTRAMWIDLLNATPAEVA